MGSERLCTSTQTAKYRDRNIIDRQKHRKI